MAEEKSITLTEYDSLIQKLDSYIFQTRLYAIGGGVLISLFIVLCFFLSLVILDSLNPVDSFARKAFFYSLVTVALVSFAYFVLFPIFRIYRSTRDISRKAAAAGLSQSLPETKDYLLNILELFDALHRNSATSNNLLYLESIKQKAHWLANTNFKDAINRKPFIKISYFFTGVVTLALLFYMISPRMFVQSAERIIFYDKTFPKYFPFDIQLVNDSMQCEQYENFTLNIKVAGEVSLPNFWLTYNGNMYKVTETRNDTFVYQIKAVKESISLKFTYGEYESVPYFIKVIPKTILTNLNFTITPPVYTGLRDTSISDLSLFPIPVNSKISYSGTIVNADSLFLSLGKEIKPVSISNSKFSGNFNLKNLADLKFLASNDTFGIKTVLTSSLYVIPDRFPDLNVDSFSDSIVYSNRYINGILSDDYGITKLILFVASADDKSKIIAQIPLEFVNKAQPQEIFYVMDFTNIPGEGNFVFWIRAYDNDAPAGFKFTDSKLFYYTKLSAKEENEYTESLSNELDKKGDDAEKILQNLKKLVQDQKKELISNDNNWMNSKKAESFQNSKDQLQNVLDELNNTLQQLSKLNENENNLQSLMDKEKAIQELLNSVMNEEIQKLLDELAKLDSQLDSKRISEINQKLDFNFKEMEKKLNSTLESLKRYEVEKRLENVIDNLKELSEQHEDTKDLTNKSTQEELKEKLENQKSLFESLKEEINAIEEKNKELEKPFNLTDTKESQELIEKNFNELQNGVNSGKGDKKSTKEKIERNAEEIEQLSENLQNNLNQMTEEEISKSIEEMRQMLDNILKLSFDQENIINRTKKLSSADPGFKDVALSENELITNFKHVEDSLRSLVTLYPQIGTVVNTEISKINDNATKVLAAIDNRQGNPAAVYQQFMLTSFNNLALLLSESIEKSKKEMNQMKGSGSGKSKSKKKGESFEQMDQQGQDFKKQLEKLLEEMKNGTPIPKLGDQLGKLLMMQEMMQQKLGEMMLDNSISPDNQNLLKEINKLMEENKRDIVNRRVNQENLLRHQEILTRLLKAENAEKERDKDDKRESNQSNLVQKDVSKFIKKTDKFKSTFKSTIGRENLLLRTFYTKKLMDYNTNLQELDK